MRRMMMARPSVIALHVLRCLLEGRFDDILVRLGRRLIH